MKEEQFRYEEFEALLARKDYSELSPEEREWVKFFVSSESEYNDLKDTLVNIRETFRDDIVQVKANVGMKESLLDRFEKVHATGQKPAGKVRPLFGSAVWKVSAIAAAVIVAFMLVFNNIGPRKDPSVAMDQSPVKVKTPDEKQSINATGDAAAVGNADEESSPAVTITENVQEGPVSSVYRREMPVSMDYTSGGESDAVDLNMTENEGTSTAAEERKEEPVVDGFAKYDWIPQPGVTTNAGYNYGSNNNEVVLSEISVTKQKKRLSKDQMGKGKESFFKDTSPERKDEIRKKLLYTDI